MHILKYINKNIAFDFKVNINNKDAIIILNGFPGKFENDSIINFYYNLGYNVFFPKYPGTYQSDGEFMGSNFIEELVNYIKFIKKGKCKSLWNSKIINFSVNKIILVGSSFAGSIACGIASKTKIDKIILYSPVWNISKHDNKTEQDLVKLIKFVKIAYKNCIRLNFSDFNNKLKKIKELNSDYYKKNISSDMLVFHDKNDKIVSINHTYNMKKDLNFNLIEHPRGHGININLLDKFKKEIETFLLN